MLRVNDKDIKKMYFTDSNNEPMTLYIEREIQQVNPDGYVQLQCIPSSNGKFEILDVSDNSKIGNYEIYDANSGVLKFDNSLIGKNLLISYMAIGTIVYSADRIFTNYDTQGNVIEVLGDIIRKCQRIITDIEAVGDAKVIIDQTQSNIDTLRELNLDLKLSQGNELKTKLDNSISTGQQINSKLTTTNSVAKETLTKMDTWVEKHGDIIELDTRVDSIESYLSINVKLFGAKGDGVSNDTEAINNCISYCILNDKTVFFPDGVYMVDSNFNYDFKGFESKKVSIRGESSNGVYIENINGFQEEFKLCFDFSNMDKIYCININSKTLGINLSNSYFQGEVEWRKSLRNKDVFIQNCIATGEPCLQGFNLYINAPAPPTYERYSHSNYQRYPIQITNGSGYNAIDINNFMTNEDGSIGTPADNSAIGIVDACINSTGVIFIDMIGKRSFQRFVKRGAEISSEVRPETVFEVHHNGHLAIGCSSDELDPVAPGWGTLKLRDNSPKIEFFDANNNNEKLSIGTVKQTWGEDFYIKFGDIGFVMSKLNNGDIVFNGFRWGGVSGGLKLNLADNHSENCLIFDGNETENLLTIDGNNELRYGSNSKDVNELSRVQMVHSASAYFRPKLNNHWKDIGYQYFDTDLNKPIWWNGTNWVDSNGSTV